MTTEAHEQTFLYDAFISHRRLLIRTIVGVALLASIALLCHSLWGGLSTQLKNALR